MRVVRQSFFFLNLESKQRKRTVVRDRVRLFTKSSRWLDSPEAYIVRGYIISSSEIWFNHKTPITSCFISIRGRKHRLSHSHLSHSFINTVFHKLSSQWNYFLIFCTADNAKWLSVYQCFRIIIRFVIIRTKKFSKIYWIFQESRIQAILEKELYIFRNFYERMQNCLGMELQKFLDLFLNSFAFYPKSFGNYICSGIACIHDYWTIFVRVYIRYFISYKSHILCHIYI